MNIITRIQILITALSLGASAAVAQQDESTTVGRAFSGVKLIKINATGGTFELSHSSTSVVQVSVTYNLDKKKYHPIFEQTDSTVFLKEEFVYKPTGTQQATWQVKIPDGLHIQFSSVAGDLNITNLKVDLSASSFSGNYTWKNTSGNCTIESPGGDIKVDYHYGNINIKGRSGNAIISKHTGNLNITTGPGDVTLSEVTGGISVTTGSGSIQAQRVTLTQKSSLNTLAGAAELWLAAPIKYPLSIDTKSGPAILHCKGNQLEGMLIMTANKKSGGIKAPFTLNKTEEIKDEATGTLRIRNTLQLGSSNNVISFDTESGVIVIKK